MLRLTIVGSVLATALLPFATAAVPAQRSLSAGGMRFTWLHVGARFIGRLHGPTAGWIAVGFNERRRLAGTRFVIAHVSTSELTTAMKMGSPASNFPCRRQAVDHSVSP